MFNVGPQSQESIQRRAAYSPTLNKELLSLSSGRWGLFPSDRAALKRPTWFARVGVLDWESVNICFCERLFV